MHVGPFLSSLAALKGRVKRCVMLYSGGLDSTYFLHWAQGCGIDVVPIYVHVHLHREGAERAAASARRLGVELEVVDAVEEFVSDFVVPAIRSDAFYQGLFPLSSSLSRPLMAKAAVEVARRVSADCVVHTAGFHQNSCARFNNSIRALAPELAIANPYLEEPITREQKRDALRAVGIEMKDGIYSIDENIWARVIENAELDVTRNPVGDHVFAITARPEDAPRAPQAVTLEFESGIPIALDGQRAPLLDIIRTLTDVGGRFGVGRFNGVEGTKYGVKNHEVREAPAAAAITLAHRHLENLVLTDREHRVKSEASREFTDLMALGHFFTDLRDALDRLITRLSVPVTGKVGLVYRPGSVYVTSVESPHSLAMDSHPAAASAEGQYSFAHDFDFETAPLLARRR